MFLNRTVQEAEWEIIKQLQSNALQHESFRGK